MGRQKKCPDWGTFSRGVSSDCLLEVEGDPNTERGRRRKRQPLAVVDVVRAGNHFFIGQVGDKRLDHPLFSGDASGD